MGIGKEERKEEKETLQAEAKGLCCAGVSTHLRVQDVVVNDLSHLGEMPAVPLAHAHGVGIELLVELVQQGDGLQRGTTAATRSERNKEYTQREKADNTAAAADKESKEYM